MQYGVFRKRVLAHLKKYKEDILGVLENGIWLRNGEEHERSHILPKHMRDKNFLPTVKKPFGLKEHRFSHHLNSSQIMCVNFFEPLRNKTEGMSLLLRLLAEETGFSFSPASRVKKAEFEFEPRKSEGTNEETNFDFYVELSGGEKIYFEIKYTERAFGGLHHEKTIPDKYSRKWHEVYSNHLRNSLYLQDFSAEEFYRHYQIWRNVSYVRTEKDYVLFIVPYENGGLYAEIQQALNSGCKQMRKNVMVIDWGSLVPKSLELSRDTEYYGHFKLFKEKYF